MSLAYVENRINEALKQSKGNETRARQIVIKWCEEDSKLLQGLTRAHLNGIVAYNIERVASGRSAKSKTTKAPAKPAAKSKDKEKFGMEILKAVVSSSTMFGLESGAAPRKKGQASQQHIDAIKKLANKNKTKK
jgi:hypothetical protein